MNYFFHLFKSNTDLIVSFFLATISCFIPKTDPVHTVLSINYEILFLLMCLMIVVAGFRKIGVLDGIYKGCFRFVDNTRSLSRIFIFINFFISMLITNDVSLIVFVPVAIRAFTCINRVDLIIPVVSLQTIAANMGSMLTPVGNPQNLYIYSYFNYQFTDFIYITFPVFAVCFVLLYIATHFIDKSSLIIDTSEKIVIPKKKASVFFVLFIICILCVLRVIDIYMLCLILFPVCFISDRKLFKKADYKLLLLFVFLFILVGNLSKYDLVSSLAYEFVTEYEYFVSLCLSQIVSNVPATVMLSSFTSDPDPLLIGVNVGGLGTIIASMASLISFKYYVKIDGAKPLYYLKKFTKYNLRFLIVLVTLHFIFPSFF